MAAMTDLPLEPRPRDFSARLLRRDARGVGARMGPGRFGRRHRGRRALALLAAVAVPAFAAPEGWNSFEIGDAGRAEVTVEPMPFERRGESFPGSAFYYLAADPAISSLAPDTRLEGESARALRIDSSGIDRSRALHCLTAAIYYEAASEPDAGQRAVAQVVLNRVAHPSYPKTVCGVVYQGSERRTGCQFSFTCDGSLARKPARFFWQRAEAVARAALSGFVFTPVGLATHYHTIAVNPYWVPRLSCIGTIGAHRFYKFGGAAGQPAAFHFAYGGGEPVAAPHPYISTAASGVDTALDPLVIQRAFESGLRASGNIGENGGVTMMPVRAAPAPVYTSELQQRGGEALYRGKNLPQASGIRPEYENSGRWIARPGV